MVKAMFFLHRRADLDREAFDRHSRSVHVPLVAQVPGLRRYVVSYALPDPAAPARAYDAVAELWFDSLEAFQAAVTSAPGAVALGDQANYLDLDRTHFLLTEEQVVL